MNFSREQQFSFIELVYNFAKSWHFSLQQAIIIISSNMEPCVLENSFISHLRLNTYLLNYVHFKILQIKIA